MGIAFLALLAVVPVTAAISSDGADAAGAAPGDGTTSATAGASCWGIKQQHPASASGTYWLLTKSMDRPAQFACDMASAGGGWVLVARGRNGWNFNPNGQGSPATVAATIDGPAAFAPAALSTETIDDLIDHGDLAALPDGIRLARATNTAGTARQDYRLFTTGRKWTWNLAAGQLLNRVVIDGATFNGSNTRDTSTAQQGQVANQLAGVNDLRRLYTAPQATKGNVQGFGMGGGGGSTAAGSYTWAAGGEGAPLGFTQVWLRPRIANDAAGFTPIPAGGFAAEAKPNALKNRSELAPWGVVGIDHTNEAVVSPWKNNVSILKVYGDRVYVGGRFTGVQQGPGATPIAQRSLAVFDLDGNWIPSFRPTFAGRVWDMTLTDDGKLVVAGDFTSVNGLPNTSGLVALDPTSGAVITSWKGSVSRSSGSMVVRAVDSRGPWIYAAGRFNSVTGGTATNVAVPNSVNLSTATGQPGSWRPVIHASAARLRVSASGDRVYLGGWFNSVNADPNHGFHAIVNPTTGAPIAGMGPYQPAEGSRVGNWYQQAVAETGDKVLVGGAEHTLQMYDRNRTTLLNSHITRAGGDFQAIEVIDGYVYASCHCMNWTYSGTNSWTNPRGYRAVDPIRMVGRWDATNLDYDTTWFPNGTKGATDEGVWGIAQDKNKCLWVGGDLIRGAYSGNAATDWLGGFARFCGSDVTPPTAPTALRATVTGESVALSWGRATDASGTVAYDVYRNDRVIATVYGTTFTDTPAGGAAGSLRYTVRAADARGNRSASPAPVAVNGPAPQLDTPVAFGSVWQYRADGADLGTAWRTPAAGDGPWQSGPGILGWGDAGQAT
ncbi:MAG TPA: fibrinogen-like YCDxxxxGGGW domain-containing protein, partial [Aquihabitans sp.]|nr:fibrinogen-like YCDxxxxGGGW domain-containing protein [Aquihabitans sp.]